MTTPTVREAITELERELHTLRRADTRWTEWNVQHRAAAWQEACYEVAIDALRGLAQPEDGS